MVSVDPISKGIAKVLGSVSKSKPIKVLKDQFQKNPEGTLAATTVASIVVKDGIGCYKYVTQSLNNKEIPEERRAFVTSMDLTNGILMIGTQLGMYALMRKYSGPLFNKLFKRSFSPKAKRDMLTKLRMEAEKMGQSMPKKNTVERNFEEVKKEGLDLFKFIFDVGIATIIGKRIITPFIATPLASMVQKRFFPINKEGEFSDDVDDICEKFGIEDADDIIEGKVEHDDD